jgi:hypothetical protein
MWQARISKKEQRELAEWWEERKKEAERLGKTPVKWEPKGKLRWPKRKKNK